MLRLIVRSIFAPHHWSYHRSSGATIDGTIGHRMPRLLVRSVAGGNDLLIVPSVAGRHDWSYMVRNSLPQVAWFPTMDLAIDILQSFVKARPRLEIDRGIRPLLEIVAKIADRSHLGNQSYDPEIVRSGHCCIISMHELIWFILKNVLAYSCM